MSKEEILQNKLNMHLRRNVVFTYKGVKYSAQLNLTEQYLASFKILSDTDEHAVYLIEKYLKDEGFFDY